METQHPNNAVDLMLFQLYCNLASNRNGNATSRRLSTRPDDLTQVLVIAAFGANLPGIELTTSHEYIFAGRQTEWH